MQRRQPALLAATRGAGEGDAATTQDEQALDPGRLGGLAGDVLHELRLSPLARGRLLWVIWLAGIDVGTAGPATVPAATAPPASAPLATAPAVPGPPPPAPPAPAPAANPLSAPPMAVLEIGSELGGCRIERQIGRGGMGVVYLAHQLGTDRKVALKAIAPSFSQDRIFRERFQREARLAALLQHPNVITVYDAGEA